MSAHLVSTEVRVYPMVTMTSTATACPTGTMEIRVPLVSPFIFNDFSMVITAVTMYQQGNHCDNSMCTHADQDPCTSSPCQHGATCTRLSSVTYSCKCTSAYFGTFCELLTGACLDPVFV